MKEREMHQELGNYLSKRNKIQKRFSLGGLREFIAGKKKELQDIPPEKVSEILGKNEPMHQNQNLEGKNHVGIGPWQLASESVEENKKDILASSENVVKIKLPDVQAQAKPYARETAEEKDAREILEISRAIMKKLSDEEKSRIINSQAYRELEKISRLK